MSFTNFILTGFYFFLLFKDQLINSTTTNKQLAERQIEYSDVSFISQQRLVNNDENIIKKLSDISILYSKQTRSVPNAAEKETKKNLPKSVPIEPKSIDGNTIQTRRIDLRDSQLGVNKDSKNKNSLEELVRSLFGTMNLENKKTSEKKINFLNDKNGELSGTDSSDDDDAERNDLWIERYRKQKLNLNKS